MVKPTLQDSYNPAAMSYMDDPVGKANQILKHKNWQKYLRQVNLSLDAKKSSQQDS
jgi:hypothetical protein